jgi:4-diphosphocytidyl-2C-methyl-D-erythritol kinase
VTGSGAAMFALCRDEEEAHRVAGEIAAQAGIPAVAVTTL